MTYRHDSLRALQGSNLLEVCRVVIVPVQLGQLDAVADVLREHPGTGAVGVQLRPEDGKAGTGKAL